MATKLPVILGMGNPLLDVSVEVVPAYIEKYELDANTQYLASPKTMPIFSDLEKNPYCKKIPGGSSQNAIRAAQWMLKTPKSAAFVGCVGDDEFGSDQRKILESENVQCLYETISTEPTGTCAALITGKNRCLVANIGAAGHFHTIHMLREDLVNAMQSAHIFYCETFFVTVSMEALLIMARHVKDNPSKVFSMNLSAKWVIQGFLSRLLELIPYADYIFCNEDEARCFAQGMGWKEQHDIPTIASNIALCPKLDPTKPRCVVITQGPDDVVMAVARFDVDCEGKTVAPAAIPVMGGGNWQAKYCCGSAEACASASSPAVPPFVAARVKVQNFAVTPIPADELKDTNGCGDSFVGGFLAALSKQKSLEDCVRIGNAVAQVVARQVGAVFPADCAIDL